MYDELERCAKEIVDNKEGADYFIYPLLVDEVVVGEELQLSVKSGTTTIENNKIKWEVPYHESINPKIEFNKIKIGEIDKNGMFTAVNVGKCIVRATIGDKKVDKKITVKCCEEEQKGDIEDLKYHYDLRIPESNFTKDRRAGKIPFPFDDRPPGQQTISLYHWGIVSTQSTPVGGIKGMYLRSCTTFKPIWKTAKC